MKPEHKNIDVSDYDLNKGLKYPLQTPTPGSIECVADGVLWLRMPMPIALDHINLYLLEDDDGWFIVDTGLHTDQAKQVWENIANTYCSQKPIKALICTHFHYDHSSLASWLMQRFNIPLYMTYGEFYTLTATSKAKDLIGGDAQNEYYRTAGVPEEKVSQIYDAFKNDPFIQFCPPSFNRLRAGDVLTIGKRSWKIIIGEGHSPEHACLYCEDDKLLLSGDQLLPHISSNILVSELEPHAKPLENWFRSLKNMHSLHPETVVLPAHGPVFCNIHVRAQQLIDHHLSTLGSLIQFVTEHPNCTAFEAMKNLFNRTLSPINTLMALGETIAHLNWLEHNDGLVCNRKNNSGINTYKYVSTDKRGKITV